MAGVEAERGEVGRVTTLELFFDLVFVFTITQLTAVIYHDPSWRTVAQVVLMLVLIWWMYGGYAWMTNVVSAHTAARRLLLLGGMTGYFVLALAVPDAFGGSGLAFGLAYLAIVAVHTALFMRAGSATVVGAIVRLARYNLAAALAVVVGGALGGSWQYLFWVLACMLEWGVALLRRPSGFAVGPAHFVERHGLVVIVAIGESVVAVGIGASHLAVDGALALAVALGLALSACLWWLYFGGDDERAVRALAALPPVERAVAALRAFGYWHLLLLLGIVTIAAAERRGLAHPFDALDSADATLLAGGVAVYLAGDALFRRTLALGRIDTRAAAALLAFATVPLGAAVAAVAQIAALVALLFAAAALEPRAGTVGGA